MIIKLFTKKDCPRCPAAKKMIDELRIMPACRQGRNHKLCVEQYDVGTVDGMAEAAFYTVMATPTILVCDESGKETAGWRGEAPNLKDLASKLK